jgi:pimeloyl-ACP methyl ester carboxylesterase
MIAMRIVSVEARTMSDPKNRLSSADRVTPPDVWRAFRAGAYFLAAVWARLDVRLRRASLLAVDPKWEIVESGPADAEQTVLLLPGGMCSARSYSEVMAEPSLTRTRLIAVTLPGQAGAAAPMDFSPEGLAGITADLAKSARVDLVVGFSMGAVVAYEMVLSGAFTGPVVLLAVSLSAADEPRFFRAVIRLGSLLGTLPMTVLKKGIGSMVKHARVPPERQAELQADFARNNAHDMLRGLQAYLRWLHGDDDRARRLCETGVPAWVLHAEKG